MEGGAGEWAFCLGISDGSSSRTADELATRTDDERGCAAHHDHLLLLSLLGLCAGEERGGEQEEEEAAGGRGRRHDRTTLKKVWRGADRLHFGPPLNQSRYDLDPIRDEFWIWISALIGPRGLNAPRWQDDGRTVGAVCASGGTITGPSHRADGRSEPSSPAFAPTYSNLCQRNLRRFDSDEVVFTSSNSIAAPALATMATIHRDREEHRQEALTSKTKRRSAAKIFEMSLPGVSPVEDAGGVATAAPAPGAVTVVAAPAAAAAVANRRPRMEMAPGQNEVEHAPNMPDESPASFDMHDREGERHARAATAETASRCSVSHCLKPDPHPDPALFQK